MAEFSLDEKNKQERERREAEINTACKKRKRRALLIGIPVVLAILGAFAGFCALSLNNNDIAVWIVVAFIVVLVGVCFTLKQITATFGAAEQRKRTELEELDGSIQSSRFRL